MIAEAGLLGIVMTHSDSFVAPHRGFGKFLGTNPLCLSAPSAGGPPVCLDMATSATAWNVIMNARRDNRAIKAGLAFDAAGNPTTDPHAVASLRPLAGHKGYALAFMIEIFCGPLNGAPWGPDIPPMYGYLAARRHLGSFVGAIDPARFFGGAEIAGEVARFAALLACTPRSPQRHPCWCRAMTTAHARSNGCDWNPGRTRPGRTDCRMVCQAGCRTATGDAHGNAVTSHLAVCRHAGTRPHPSSN